MKTAVVHQPRSSILQPPAAQTVIFDLRHGKPQTGLGKTQDGPIPSRYPQLDLIRGIAACLVAGGHWRCLFFQDYEAVRSPGILCRLFYFFTGFGHQAVIIFFVLSGFVICNTIHANVTIGKWSFREYFVARLTRLWVVLIPALILGYFLDSIGVSTLHGGGIYRSAGFGHILNGVEANHLGLTVLLGNTLFLQTIIVPTLGSNGPLWSLANEFWYYVVFPLFLMAFRGGYAICVRILLATLGFAVLAMTGPGISSYFPIWLMGCGVFYALLEIPLSNRASLTLCAVSGMCSSAILIGSRYHRLDPLGNFGQDFVLGLAIASGLIGIVKTKLFERASFFAGMSQGLTRPSYSLYLLHLPFFVFIASRFFKSSADRWVPDAVHVVLGLLVVISCALYVWLLFKLTEEKTGIVRSWVLKLLRFSNSAPRREVFCGK